MIIKRLIENPFRVFSVLAMRGMFNWLGDKPYLKMHFRAQMGKWPNLKKPRTFNEKLQWLKLYDRKPIYTTLVDKLAVKQFVAELIGDKYIIPTLGVWDSFDDIDFSKLPNQFVLKCTHDSGGLVVCSDKNKFDMVAAKEKIKASLGRNYYFVHREWPYKNVKPRIIAEQYMEDKNGEFNDYKFFCFDGKIDCVMVVTDRAKKDPHYYYMSRDWTILPYGRLTRSLPKDFTLPKPDHLEEMFTLAEQLSKGFPFVRMDFYNVDGRIYFGEYTLYSQSGFEDGFDDASDLHLGSLLKLPPKTGTIN